jgi:arylsulfatase A
VVNQKLANSPAPRLALYDLSKDPREKNNLAEKNPEILKKMKNELQKILDDGRSR